MLIYQINDLCWRFLLFFHWIKQNGSVRIGLVHKVSAVDEHQTI